MANLCRLFLSSTFSDFTQEREILHQQVFPRIEQAFEEKGFQFEAVDLRWGVSESAGRHYETMNVCLEEVAKCRDTGVRPHFLMLLGQRYGWRPLPYDIPVDEFRKIVAAIADSDQRDLLQRAYRLDRNAVRDKAYFLRTVDGSGVPVFDPRLSENEIRAALLCGVEQAFGRGSIVWEKFTRSATHHEIEAGILSRHIQPGEAFAYFRDLQNFPESQHREPFFDLDEYPWSQGDDSAARIAQLRQQVEHHLGAAHCRYYSATWNPVSRTEEEANHLALTFLMSGRDASQQREVERQLRRWPIGSATWDKWVNFIAGRYPPSVPNHDGWTTFRDGRPWSEMGGWPDPYLRVEDLNEFAERVYRDLLGLIETTAQRSPPDWLEQESSAQRRLLELRSLGHRTIHTGAASENQSDEPFRDNETPRWRDTDERPAFVSLSSHTTIRTLVRNFMLSDSFEEQSATESLGAQVLLISGRAGSGKTALIADALFNSPESASGRRLVYRLLGQTRASTRPNLLFESLASEINKFASDLSRDDWNLAEEQGPPEDAALLNALSRSGSRVLLVLDGLHELDEPSAAYRLINIINACEAPVKVILTGRSFRGNLPAISQAARSRRVHKVDIGNLDAPDCEEILNAWMRARGRELTVAQMSHVRQHFYRCRMPVVQATMIADIATRWRSDDVPQALGNTVGGTIDELINTLETRRHHEHWFLRPALGFLSLPEFGIGELDFQDCLNGDASLMKDFANHSITERERRLVKDGGRGRLPIIYWARLKRALGPYLELRVEFGRTFVGFRDRVVREHLRKRFAVSRHYTTLTRTFDATAIYPSPRRSASKSTVRFLDGPTPPPRRDKAYANAILDLVDSGLIPGRSMQRRTCIAYTLPFLKHHIKTQVSKYTNVGIIEPPFQSSLWGDFALVIGDTLWLYRIGGHHVAKEIKGWSHVFPGRVMLVVIPPPNDLKSFEDWLIDLIHSAQPSSASAVIYPSNEVDYAQRRWIKFYESALNAIQLAPGGLRGNRVSRAN